MAMTDKDRAEFAAIWEPIRRQVPNGDEGNQKAMCEHAAWLMFRAMKEREAVPVPIVNAARERKFGDIVAEAFSAAKGGGK